MKKTSRCTPVFFCLFNGLCSNPILNLYFHVFWHFLVILNTEGYEDKWLDNWIKSIHSSWYLNTRRLKLRKKETFSFFKKKNCKCIFGASWNSANHGRVSNSHATIQLILPSSIIFPVVGLHFSSIIFEIL